ncbi:putative Ca2+/H+ antiporter (TMEM165/GDT1 family) [Sphingomonas zeicaulis]|uniref:TMEM165/GDT1 family protein n=1 Tax=Sphingomonas zeicaulis TaxID=1632740 RepID=UPI003D1C483C
MEALLTSMLVVALAEIGDKTQLLAILLATRFKRPWPIIAGILAATLANHALAALVGSEVAALIDARWFRYAVAISFIVMAVWTLVPDSDEGLDRPGRSAGAFVTTIIAFFIVEMGDKTQIATVALAAQFRTLLWVTLGTTIGMMIANIPAVLLGEAVLRRVPMTAIRVVAAATFLILGIWMLARTAAIL